MFLGISISIKVKWKTINICDWLCKNPPVMHKDNYLERRN